VASRSPTPARVLSRYVDALAIRTFASRISLDYAHWASNPVINALTDLEHPARPWLIFLTLKVCLRQPRWPVACLVGRWQQLWPTRCCLRSPAGG